jgi:hypothetical protein
MLMGPSVGQVPNPVMQQQINENTLFTFQEQDNLSSAAKTINSQFNNDDLNIRSTNMDRMPEDYGADAYEFEGSGNDGLERSHIMPQQP